MALGKGGIARKIREESKRQGANSGKIFDVADGKARTVRFLTDFDDGYEVHMHGNYQLGIKDFCCLNDVSDTYCKGCDDEELKTSTMYAWTVVDTETNQKFLMLYKVNDMTPVPQLEFVCESYGTLLDRDISIRRTGVQLSTSYQVLAGSPYKYTGKHTPFTEKQVMEILKAARPAPEQYMTGGMSEEIYEPENVVPSAPDKRKVKLTTDLPEPYCNMKPSELWKECYKRGIKVEQRLSQQVYGELLVEDDNKDEWKNLANDEDDGWGDDWDTEEGFMNIPDGDVFDEELPFT